MKDDCACSVWITFGPQGVFKVQKHATLQTLVENKDMRGLFSHEGLGNGAWPLLQTCG